MWRQSAGGNRTVRPVAIAVEARATMHVTDDLLRLSSAAVPLIASVVTGTFLFVNRSGRVSSGSGLWLKFIRVCLRTSIRIMLCSARFSGSCGR